MEFPWVLQNVEDVFHVTILPSLHQKSQISDQWTGLTRKYFKNILQYLPTGIIGKIPTHADIHPHFRDAELHFRGQHRQELLASTPIRLQLSTVASTYGV